MKVWTNHVDSIVAETIDDVYQIVRELYGDADATEMINEGYVPVPDDKPITIRNADGNDHAITMTAGEWAKHCARGLLCSTEY